MNHAEKPVSPSLAPKRSLRWPLIVVGLLVTHVLFMVLVAVIAVSDRSFAVLPDYYRKALNWDQDRAALAAGERLGWKLRIDPSSRVNPLGQRSVRFELTDSSGRPVGQSKLRATYFHHAHAADAKRIELEEDSPGRFVATLPMRQSGLWQFDVTIDAGGQAFAATVVQFVEMEGLR